MSFRWEEEVPQPKPPTNRVRLAVQTWCVEKWDPNFRGEQEPDWGMSRDADMHDIARALGMTPEELGGLLARRDAEKLFEKESASVEVSPTEADGFVRDRTPRVTGETIATTGGDCERNNSASHEKVKTSSWAHDGPCLREDCDCSPMPIEHRRDGT